MLRVLCSTGKKLKMTIQRANLQHRPSTMLGSNAQGNKTYKRTKSGKHFVAKKKCFLILHE